MGPKKRRKGSGGGGFIAPKRLKPSDTFPDVHRKPLLQTEKHGSVLPFVTWAGVCTSRCLKKRERLPSDAVYYVCSGLLQQCVRELLHIAYAENVANGGSSSSSMCAVTAARHLACGRCRWSYEQLQRGLACGIRVRQDSHGVVSSSCCDDDEQARMNSFLDSYSVAKRALVTTDDAASSTCNAADDNIDKVIPFEAVLTWMKTGTMEGVFRATVVLKEHGWEERVERATYNIQRQSRQNS